MLCLFLCVLLFLRLDDMVAFVFSSIDSDSFYLSIDTLENGYNSKHIANFFEAVDNSNETVRQAKIIFHHRLSDSEMLEMGEQLDKFLTPRLWWNVLVEPFAWHEANKNGLTLSRCSADMEQHFRLVSSVQYPESKICDKSHLIVDHFDGFHVAWGNNLGIKASTHYQFPFTPATSYNSRSNDPAAERESVAWISAHECNTTNNKWECAFLPRTNCTLPDQLTKCSGEDCVYKLPETVNGGSVFNSANALGKALSKEEVNEISRNFQQNSNARVPMSELQSSLAKYNDPPHFKMAVAYNESFPLTIRPGESSKATTYIFGAIMRNNYRFRSLIAEQIHTFYHKNNMNFNTRCVAAQVRRGDRIVKGVDMIELCKNATKPITEQNPVNYCRDYDGQMRNCGLAEKHFTGGLASNKGCESVVPFGAVTVDMLIRAAKELAAPEVKTLFVSTDDEAWLESEKIIAKKQHPEWAVVNLEAPKMPENENPTFKANERFAANYEYMRYRSGAKSGAFFLASLQLTQQCEAFMGHYTSTIPYLFMQAMCYKSRNGQLTGVCPPVYDLRTGIV